MDPQAPSLTPAPKPHPMARFRHCKTAFDFAADLEGAAQVLAVETPREAAVMLALTLHRKVSERTPVDSGRARANWFLAEGAPRIEAEDTTIAEPAPTLSGNSVIYLTNSLPYIVPLEYGHSKQAPHGMLRTSIAEVTASINLGGKR
jgi:hypothetical protein